MRAAWLVVAAFTVGCGNPDADGDGLETKAEVDLGTDPDVADSDGDGLNDGDEVAANTDPLTDDSDGDGLSDGDETRLGLDPLDETDDGYRGGWPLQAPDVKDGIAANGKPGATFEIGKRFPRWKMKDQYNEEVDLYDFSAQGTKIIIDVSAQWCPPCNAMSAFLDGDDDVWGDPVMTEQLMPLRTKIKSGELLWITVLPQKNDGGAAVLKDKDAGITGTAQEWADAYPTKKIPVLADIEQKGEPYVVDVTLGWPTFLLLNENMTVVESGIGIDFSTILPKLD